MNRKFAALAVASAFVAGSATYGVALMYNTHAHMHNVRGDSYTLLPFTDRFAYVADTSWQRFRMRANNNEAGEEAVLNRATYGLPCTHPVVKP